MYPENIWLLLTGVLSAIFSYCCFIYSKDKLALLFLFLSALFIRLFIVYLDPFLHNWDERFHALVARNMMDNLFKPMLKTDTVLPFDFQAWKENHIWLHKQPLFMWQMALSMKLFGVSEFSMRYPSVLMGSLMVIFIYRITWNMTKDRLLSYSAAFLMCFSNYQLELTSGFIGMDHNDVAFGFYVCASFWAYAESINDRRILWILLIGFFAGCAVLNKWLTGLLVFAGWGINILLSIKSKELKKEIFRFILALIACLVVFVPWQLYILKNFPIEAKYEYAYNSQHVFKAIENHGGGYLFYYHKLRQYFGLFTWQILLVGAVIYLFSKTESGKIKIALGTSFLIIFLFFSLVVKTKMQSYLFVVGPIGYIFMAFAIVKSIRVLKLPDHFSTAVISICLFTCSFFLLNYAGIVSFFHNPSDPERIAKIRNTAIYKNLHTYIQPNTKYILNLSQLSEVELMFYNKDIVACHGNIDSASLNLLFSKKLPIGIFKNHSHYTDGDLINKSSLFYKIDADLGDF